MMRQHYSDEFEFEFCKAVHQGRRGLALAMLYDEAFDLSLRSVRRALQDVAENRSPRAYEKRYGETLKQLIKSFPGENWRRLNAFSLTILAGRPDLAERMLVLCRWFAPVQNLSLKMDADDRTALHIALEREFGRLSDILICFGAPPSAKDKEGRTPLHVACQKNMFNAVRHLLALGVNPNTPTKTGQMPMHCVLEKGATKDAKLTYLIVEMLLRYDAIINKRNGDLHTPLLLFLQQDWTAALSMGRDILFLLLRNGSRIIEGRRAVPMTPEEIMALLDRLRSYGSKSMSPWRLFKCMLEVVCQTSVKTGEETPETEEREKEAVLPKEPAEEEAVLPKEPAEEAKHEEAKHEEVQHDEVQHDEVKLEEIKHEEIKLEAVEQPAAEAEVPPPAEPQPETNLEVKPEHEPQPQEANDNPEAPPAMTLTPPPTEPDDDDGSASGSSVDGELGKAEEGEERDTLPRPIEDATIRLHLLKHLESLLEESNRKIDLHKASFFSSYDKRKLNAHIFLEKHGLLTDTILKFSRSSRKSSP